jgi:hypothetical protein
VKIDINTVLSTGTVWRSGIIVKEKPGRVIGEVEEGWANRAGGEAGAGGGMEKWGWELWASVGNHVKRGDGR